jgi:hypothetical protein
MNFQTATKAVELKNLIDNAHLYLPDIGRCLSLELKFRRPHIRDDDEDDDDEDDDEDDGATQETVEGVMATLEKIQDKLAKIYDMQGFRMQRSGFEDGSISVLGQEIQCLKDISLEDIKKWYTLAMDSGFGNVTKQETQHDTEVRSSRELDVTQFTVSQKTLDDIALKWGEEFIPNSYDWVTNPTTLLIWGQKFVPESVRVQPYKIVIYGPGDHFNFHKDTPEEGLCGTFLISLYEDCKPYTAFEIRQGGESYHWSGHLNG